MHVKIGVGPPQLSISEGTLVLVTEEDGQIIFPSDKGLYFFDTRMVSSWNISANGVEWDLLSSGAVAHFAARAYLTNKPIQTEDGLIPGRCVGLSIGRSLGGGMHEDIDIVNHSGKAIRFNLEIIFRCDFADLFEVKSGSIVRRGRIVTEWSRQAQTLKTSYRNRDFFRDIAISVRNFSAPPIYANGRLSFEVELAPAAKWHACLLYRLHDGNRSYDAPRECIENCEQSEASRRIEKWRSQVLKIRSGNELFTHLFSQAVEDMAALRLPIAESGNGMRYVPAAGVPWFVALFGRDSLIASLQTLIVYRDFASATLDVLATHQAEVSDDYRDADPGKIMHELRMGELAHFKSIPHTPYYGTADATSLFLILLNAAWRVTGEESLLRKHLATAERCLDWIDNFGDLDGDGLQEYQTRSSAGYSNQGWKDAEDAIVDVDGTSIKGPKALCELQGYAYDAWRRMADIYDHLGNAKRSDELREKASRLKKLFNDRFWDEEVGFYALALDGDKKRIMSVASNAGHCMWSGIVYPERAERMVARLLEPDMNSGWGTRTLSQRHQAFNPFSYQCGSVWPHDNAILATGLRRYGFDVEALALIRDVCDAGNFFNRKQFPELYGGSQKTRVSFPLQYLGANVPQAWAAGSVFAFLQTIIGYQPDAGADVLYLDPVLPDWLPNLELLDLRFGPHTLDITFLREGDNTSWRVTRGDASRVKMRRFANTPA